MLTHVHMRSPAEEKKMVRWTEEERLELADRVWHLRVRHPDCSVIELLNRAQKELLPEDRQRFINAVKTVPFLPTALREMDEKLIAEREELKAVRETNRQVIEQNRTLQTHVSASTKEAVLNQLGEEEIVAKFAKIVLNNLSPDEIMGSFAPDELLAVIPLPKIAAFFAENFVAQMGGGISDMLAHMTQPEVQQHAATNGTTQAKINGKQKTPKVVVIGPKSEQFQILQRRLGGIVELVCIDKNRKKDMPQGGDLYVIWTRFCSHGLQSAIQKAAGNNKIMLHNGGLEILANRIAGEFLSNASNN